MIFTIRIYSQQLPNNPDWISYQHYLDARWDSVIYYSQRALSQSSDHYYLRMRMGIAYYMQGNYLKAAHHFEKALKFEPLSYDAKYYLFRCYEWTNRSTKIDLWISRMKPYEKNHFKELQFSWFRGVDLYTGIKTTNQRSPKGTQRFLVAAFTHALSSRTYLYHQLTFFQENISRQQTIRQFQFYSAIPIPFSANLLFTPSIHYVNTDDGYSQHSFLLKYFDIRYDYKNISYSVFGGFTGSIQKEQSQFGMQGIWYPAGNLNHYTALSVIMHRDTLGKGRFSPVISMLGGMAVSNHLWLEAEATFGKRTHFFESSGSLVYNTPDAMYEKIAIRPIFLAGKEITLYAKLIYEKKKDFVRKDIFNHFTFLGGISWNVRKNL